MSKTTKKKAARRKPNSKPKRKASRSDGTIEKVARVAGWVTGAIEGDAGLLPTRDLFGSIKQRRSHKKFKPAEVEAEKIRIMLEAAVLAPNHKLTQPWGFLVLGPRAKHVYADTKARLKLAGHLGAEGKAKAESMMAEVLAIPAILGITQKLDNDPMRREEDYAAVFMAVQNLLLAATAMGLGTKIHTGDILDDSLFRSALGLDETDRLVAIVDVGEPADEPAPKKRALASEKTRWLD